MIISALLLNMNSSVLEMAIQPNYNIAKCFLIKINQNYVIY